MIWSVSWPGWCPTATRCFAIPLKGPMICPLTSAWALTQTDLTIPIRDGTLDLGTWQGVYLWEHRSRPHRRRLTVTLDAA